MLNCCTVLRSLPGMCSQSWWRCAETVCTHIMTPAEAPRLPLSHLGFARLLQNTSSAPRHVQAPAAMTRPKAKAKLPSAACGAVQQQQASTHAPWTQPWMENAALFHSPRYQQQWANSRGLDPGLRRPAVSAAVACCTHHVGVLPLAWEQHVREHELQKTPKEGYSVLDLQLVQAGGPQDGFSARRWVGPHTGNPQRQRVQKSCRSGNAGLNLAPLP